MSGHYPSSDFCYQCDNELSAICWSCSNKTHSKLKEEAEQLRFELEKVRKEYADYRGIALLAVQLAEQRVESLVKRQRDECAKAALDWSKTQDQVAEDKERDCAFCSAEMHREEAIMARRISVAIQNSPLVSDPTSDPATP